MHHNHITVLRGGEWCQVLSGESNLRTRAFSPPVRLKNAAPILIFPSVEIQKAANTSSLAKCDETMALLYSIMQFLQELEV